MRPDSRRAAHRPQYSQRNAGVAFETRTTGVRASLWRLRSRRRHAWTVSSPDPPTRKAGPRSLPEETDADCARATAPAFSDRSTHMGTPMLGPVTTSCGHRVAAPDAGLARRKEGSLRHYTTREQRSAACIAGGKPSGRACVPQCGVVPRSRRVRSAHSARLALQHTGSAAVAAGSGNRP